MSSIRASLWLHESDRVGTSGAALEERTDAIVIGGGIAGVVTALHLARKGVQVTLLERGEIASRASGRNDGQLLLGLGEHYNRIHGQFGAERAPLLWAFLRENHDALLAELAASRIGCDLAQRGGLRLAETEHEWCELQQAAELLTNEGKPHQLLATEDVRKHLPLGEGFHGGLYLAEEAIVQPAKMVRGLAAAAVAVGAQIMEQAEVASIEGEAGAFEVSLRDGRKITASIVVHCTSALGRDLDPTGLLERAIFPFRGQIIATDALPTEVAAQFPDYAMSSNFCYEYFRMHKGRFVIGGKRWSVPGEEQNLIDDTEHNAQISGNLRDYAHHHFPALRDTTFPHVWTGIMAGTPDGLPLCGSLPGQPGVFALLGFNGYGLGFAYLAGKSLAEMIVEGQGQHPALGMFAPRRLQPS